MDFRKLFLCTGFLMLLSVSSTLMSDLNCEFLKSFLPRSKSDQKNDRLFVITNAHKAVEAETSRLKQLYEVHETIDDYTLDLTECCGSSYAIEHDKMKSSSIRQLLDDAKINLLRLNQALTVHMSSISNSMKHTKSKESNLSKTINGLSKARGVFSDIVFKLDQILCYFKQEQPDGHKHHEKVLSDSNIIAVCRKQSRKPLSNTCRTEMAFRFLRNAADTLRYLFDTFPLKM